MMMNLYYVYGIKETNFNYVVLASTKEKAEDLFTAKIKVQADPKRTKRLLQGAYIVACNLLIDDIS